MIPSLDIVWELLSALGVGALIGIERGWYGRAEDEGDRIAGIRTFSLVGLLGGITATLMPLTGEWLLGVVFLSLSALIVISYSFEIKLQGNDDIGITTEVALILTFALSVWAALGYQLEALGAAVVVITILSLKPVLHKWLRKIEVEEIYGGIKLLVISVIMLPLLPDQGYGPWQTLNPYWIWWMVVLISGLSFTGYILMKYIGENKGTMITSVIGGMASSTAVTITLAKFARERKTGSIHIFTAGILIASVIMFIRVIIEVSVVNPALLQVIWKPITAMVFLTIVCVIWLWARSGKTENHTASDNPDFNLSNPLQLPTALKFGLALGAILLLSTALKEWFGDQGIYLLALISGLMDVDAITLSLSRMAENDISSRLAVMGILIAVISNTLVKAGFFIYLAGIKKSIRLIWMMVAISAGGILSAWFFI